ncbi:hypothetical protein ABZ468_25075 [Streptomyces sp. NPDC005708]|uniref:hypothetical protein n=1 Tax=Streptomyces sp. NPDC005708 TaxID=3154564 RepID=UPI0033E44BC7
MIRQWIKVAGRSGRIGLMLGLLVLITAHLSGAVHGTSFASPHMSALAVISEHDADDDASHAPPPDHKSGAHIDHVADRPRTALQDTAAEPDHESGSPAASPATMAPDICAAWCHLPQDSAAVQGSSTLALHCVWRQ